MPNELTTSTTAVTESAPGAAEVQQNTQTAAVQQQETSQYENAGMQSAQPAQSEVQKGDEFAEALRTEMLNYMDAEPQTHQEQQTQQQEQSQQPEQQPKPEEQQPSEPKKVNQQDGKYQVENYESPYFRDEDGREVIPSVYIEELGREVTLEEVLDKFKGFDYYHQNAEKQQADAQRIVQANQQLNRQRQELQEKLDELNAQKQDPMFKVLQLFKGDDDLKKQVTNYVRKLRPNGFRNLQGRTQLEADRAKMENMEKELAQLKNIEMLRAQAIQSQQNQNVVNQTTKQIEQFVNNRVAEFKQHGIEISNEELKAIADSYIPMVNTQGYSFEKVAQHFDNYFRLLANKSQQLVNNYQQQKRAVAPAPPSGGAAPSIAPTPIRGAEDFESTLASRLAQMLKGV